MITEELVGANVSALLPAQLTFNPEEVAKLLGLGSATIYEALRAGTLPSFRIGKRWKVTRTTLQRLLGDVSQNERAALV